MPVLTRSMRKQVEAQEVQEAKQFEPAIITTYQMPSFSKPISDQYSWLLSKHCEVEFTNAELRKIINMFIGCNTYSGLSIKNELKGAINYYLVKSRVGVTADGWKFKVESIQIMLKNFTKNTRAWSSYPYNYILYGRTEKEIDDIVTEHYDDEIGSAFNQISRIQETPHEQFKKIFPLNIKLLEAEILFSKKCASNYRMVNLVRREIDYLNEHHDHTMERLIGEQRELILQNIQDVKEQIRELVINYDIMLPEDLALELFRQERIFKTVAFMEQMENKVSPNLNQIIINKDLGRYLMEFIN